MIYIVNMKKILLAILIIFAFKSVGESLTNPSPPVARKEVPTYRGVNPKLGKFVKEYLKLAKKHDIKFTNSVSVGMTTINRGNIIGLCTYGKNFREIDIDQPFFDKSSDLTREILIFHELTHCYCDRDHDFGLNQPYTYPLLRNFFHSFYKEPFWKNPGFYADECPISIMYPAILRERCAEEHFDAYLEEMFDRCNPY